MVRATTRNTALAQPRETLRMAFAVFSTFGHTAPARSAAVVTAGGNAPLPGGLSLQNREKRVSGSCLPLWPSDTGSGTYLVSFVRGWFSFTFFRSISFVHTHTLSAMYTHTKQRHTPETSTLYRPPHPLPFIIINLIHIFFDAYTPIHLSFAHDDDLCILFFTTTTKK